MRIIAGTKKGMALACPKTQDTRPITDRVKESLFNVLINYDLIADQQVADLFSGVGSLGLEALSRGAKFATFVEQDAKIGSFLERNIARAGFGAQCRVVRSNAFVVGAPPQAGAKHDLVFVDPPYARSRDIGSGSQLVRLFETLGRQIAPKGVAVVRTEKGIVLPETYGPFAAVDRRDWGSMSIVLLQVRDHGE